MRNHLSAPIGALPRATARDLEWAVLAFMRECQDGGVSPEFLTDCEQAAELHGQLHTGECPCGYPSRSAACGRPASCRDELEREAARLRAAVVARALR